MESRDEALDRVTTEANRLVHVTATYRPRLVAIERHVIDHMAMISADGQRCLTVVRRILAAVEERLDALSKELSTGTDEAVRAALQLAISPIILKNDSLNKLITEAELPPISPIELKNVLETLLSKIQVKRRPRYASF